MNIEEIKQTISEKTGIPIKYLPGEDAEEIIKTARQLLRITPEPKTKREQFAAFMSAALGDQEPDKRETALNEIEKSLRPYPVLDDSGETPLNVDPRTTREKFAEFLAPAFSFNPFRD